MLDTFVPVHRIGRSTRYMRVIWATHLRFRFASAQVAPARKTATNGRQPETPLSTRNCPPPHFTMGLPLVIQSLALSKIQLVLPV